MHSLPVTDCRLTFGNSLGGKACKVRVTSLWSRERFKLNSSVLRTLARKLSSTLHHKRIQNDNWISCGSCFNPITRDLWHCTWLRSFNISWSWASRIISIYLFCLNLVAEAHDDPSPSLMYACEDVHNYYDHVEHLKGEELKKKLNSIIAKHRPLSFKEVWNALKILDAAEVDKPEASSEIVEIYSSRVVSKNLAGKPEGWNREHLWPRSFGLTYGPSLTDLHNIRPADSNVNSSRGNKYYGECSVSSTDCLKPANKEAASDTETDKERWAPPFQVRGDIARALMYMAVCYGFHQPGGSPDLHLSDSPSTENREMGLLSTLLKWNEVDPPSREEKLRNERICKLYQHNRNPFVDHPEYANLIWKQASPSHQGFYTPFWKAWINEFHYNEKGRDQNEASGSRVVGSGGLGPGGSGGSRRPGGSGL